MPENGDIPLTGDPRVDAALTRIRGKFRDLEDAMVIQAHLEKRMAEQVKAHAEWLGGLTAEAKRREREAERRDREQEQQRRRLNDLAEQTDRRIADLVRAIGKLIEARSN